MSDKNSTATETKNNVDQSSPSQLMVDNDGGCLCPVTPYSNKESVNSTSKCISPSTLVSPPTNITINDNGPFTLMEDVFSPLAWGTENLILGSTHMKNIENSGSYVARRLNFSSKGGTEECASESKVEDGSVIETVYESILEGIISKHAEDILAEIVASDVLMTPKNVARISGIADTCPGAPLKRVAVRKFRNVAASSCRKLEF